jgi:hypothetical protein
VKAQRDDVFEESLYDKFVRKLGDRFSKQLYEQVKTIQDVKPTLKWQTIVTLTVAAGVFLSWVFFINLDIWLIVQFPNVFAVIGCVLCSLIVGAENFLPLQSMEIRTITFP